MRIKNLIILLLVTTNLFSQTNLTQIVEKCKPSVFSITTYDENNKPLAYGTGFFIDSNGTGLTNYHVFEGASKAIIKTLDGNIYPVNNILSQSKSMDIIKFTISNTNKSKFHSLKIALNKPKEGESVFLIGNPSGLEFSVSNGIVSSIRNDENYGNIIQITAPISSGSSGSPLMNMKGEVIGIISFTYSEGQNLNFAICISDIYKLNEVNNLIFPKEKEIQRPTDVIFKRFDWGSSSSYILENEKLSFIGKDGNSAASSQFFVTYIGSFAQLRFIITYCFNYDKLESIRFSPANKKYIEGSTNTFPLYLTDYTTFSETHGGFMTLEKKLIDILGDNFLETGSKNNLTYYDLKNSLGHLTITEDAYSSYNNISKAKDDIYYKQSRYSVDETIIRYYITHEWANYPNNTDYKLVFENLNNKWTWYLYITQLKK